ncbi:MAG TPA: hypothetical protein VG796_22170 [Verrucomicrobiales bacterium]|nr:hypothetical protein [Verrucomicrobiales bacterium]
MSGTRNGLRTSTFRSKNSGACGKNGRCVSERTQKALAKESGLSIRRELLLKRVKHFTRGVIIGSLEFIDTWFERHRPWFGGRSRTHRETGARPISKEWRGLYNLRQLRP